MEKCPQDDVFKAESCGHDCCRECMRNHVLNEFGNMNNFPCRCPRSAVGCENFLTQTESLQCLDYNEQNEFLKKERKKIISVCADIQQCTQPDCEGHAEMVGGNTNFECPVCQHRYCVECGADDWHLNATCEQHREQYREWEQNNAEGDAMMDEYMKDKSTCPQCKNGVEKTEGCNHMTCICGQHFCYLCDASFGANEVSQHFDGNFSGGGCKLFTGAAYEAD